MFDIDDSTLVDELGLDLNKIGEKSWIVKTGRGYHVYSKSKENPGSTTKYDELKIEHRANGAYVVAPPSRHSSGRKYEFVNATSPDDMPELKEQNTKLIWTQLVNRVSKLKGIQLTVADMPERLDDIDAPCVANMLDGVKKGKRNDTAFALTQYYRYVKKLSPTETEMMVKGWNDSNKPSLSKQEIETVIKSAINGKKQSGCTKIRSLGFCPYKITRDCPFLNKNIKAKIFSKPPKNLEEVYQRLRKWIYMKKTDRVDLILATAISTFSNDKPIWIFLMGASGDAKSELVRGLSELPFVRKIDQLTANTLVSGKINKDGSPVEDLGYELQNSKTLLVFTDLAFLTSLNKDEKKVIWGQFRNLYDGELQKDTGVGVKKHYKNCHVTMLACTTSAIKDEFHINQQLGTRELMYGTEAQPEDDIFKMRKALMHKSERERLEQEIQETLCGYLETKEFNEDIELPEYIINFLVKKCFKLKILRASASSVDWSTGELMADAEAEVPTRLIQQFGLLYRALHSLEEDYPDEKFFEIIENIVRSSSHPVRYAVYEYMKKQPGEWVKLHTISKDLSLGRKSTYSQCEILWNLNVFDKKEEIEQIGGFITTNAEGHEVRRGGRFDRVVYYKFKKKIIEQVQFEDVIK